MGRMCCLRWCGRWLGRPLGWEALIRLHRRATNKKSPEMGRYGLTIEDLLLLGKGSSSTIGTALPSG